MKYFLELVDHVSTTASPADYWALQTNDHLVLAFASFGSGHHTLYLSYITGLAYNEQLHDHVMHRLGNGDGAGIGGNYAT